MILRVALLCLVGLAIGVYALDSNYPIFNPDDGLPSSSPEKLNKILVASEAALKRIEALDYKLNRMEVANQEKLDGLRVQLSEMTRRMTNVEYVMSHVKSEMEALKELDRYSRDPPARSEPYTSPTTSSLSQGDVQDKLKSLAILTSSVRSAVSRIEREVHGMALNTTQLMQNLSYLQRNAPTKQFINSALLGLKNQAQIYPTMTGAVTGSGEFIWSPGNGAIAGQWMNQSVATNCKYTPRKFGINRIQLFGVGSVKDPFFVNCFDGWTIIQQRSEGSLSFHRAWDDYKIGFGNIDGEFWIGLDKLHELTMSRPHELLIELEDFDGEKRKARYSHFAVGDEREHYALILLGKYSGDAGDSMSYHAGQKFTTFDKDNDVWVEGNCAKAHHGAWWYNACETSNLNGHYLEGVYPDEVRYHGVYWQEFRGPNYSLKKTRMLIRPIE